MKARIAVAIAALTVPAALGIVSAPAANAADGCGGNYAFAGWNIANQDNGFRIEFPGNGKVVNGRVTAFNNRQVAANRGNIEGNINGREVFLRVFWDNGSVGTYNGSINSNGKVRGQTHGEGGTAQWNLNATGPLPCA